MLKRLLAASIRVLWLAVHPISHAEQVYAVMGTVVTVLILLGIVGAGAVGAFAPSPLPDPSPRWPLVVVYPSLVALVLVLIAAVRLQLRLDRLLPRINFTSGATIKDEQVHVSLLFRERDTIANVTFEGCTFQGPALVAFQGNIVMNGIELSGRGTQEDRFIVADEGRTYGGLGVFVHCRFENCHFDNVAFLVAAEMKDQLMAETVVV